MKQKRRDELAESIRRSNNITEDRTHDFEARCSECGAALPLLLEVTTSKTVMLEAVECPIHPGRSMILWPQQGVRRDIIRRPPEKKDDSNEKDKGPKHF